MSDFAHIPVLLEEALSLLRPERGGVYIDGTLGGGGHARAVLDKLDMASKLVGIDRDSEAIAAASEALKPYGSRFTAIRGNFFDMKRLLAAAGIGATDGILLDLGVSSHQLDSCNRGFSYREDAPLDMRMDAAQALSAYDVVNGYSFEELARIIREYGEERYAGRVAGQIVKEREARAIESTAQLAEIVRKAIGGAGRREAQHPARRTFQAIRIEVNGELDGLEGALRDAESLLRPDGVLAVITFHSLEDRIVKRTFRSLEHPCICDRRAPVCTCGKVPTSRALTKRPITPTEAELARNARSHSAKLRAIEKL
ncbi:MAG: 16S rRNA (cytosine(1402)-N(4))-methyltransferase RsmH [Clostridia bacterium]|nr:16S rRNA (cytosine(1402)-N(4))-methyltransferase RsmH [Clostridia bacterium]